MAAQLCTGHLSNENDFRKMKHRRENKLPQEKWPVTFKRLVYIWMGLWYYILPVCCPLFYQIGRTVRINTEQWRCSKRLKQQKLAHLHFIAWPYAVNANSAHEFDVTCIWVHRRVSQRTELFSFHSSEFVRRFFQQKSHKQWDDYECAICTRTHSHTWIFQGCSFIQIHDFPPSFNRLFVRFYLHLFRIINGWIVSWLNLMAIQWVKNGFFFTFRNV